MNATIAFLTIAVCWTLALWVTKSIMAGTRYAYSADEPDQDYEGLTECPPEHYPSPLYLTPAESSYVLDVLNGHVRDMQANGIADPANAPFWAAEEALARAVRGVIRSQMPHPYPAE